jgi:O-succinylbenzoic acid--CoA ligase
METAGLNSAEYWESADIDIRLNPKRSIDDAGLGDFLREDCGIEAAVVMATSGSSGRFKFAVLPKVALLNSAGRVIEHCGLTREDIWLAGLSGFHVGGLGIYARAYMAGSRLVEFPGEWERDGRRLVNAIEKTGATLTSMTPTHLHDLVSHGMEAPSSLRGLLLGGGKMEPILVDSARQLGWPVWPSYGMTEASSQIATSTDGSVDYLPVLDGWELKTDGEKRLAIRGESLFAGYAIKETGGWRFDEARDGEGWFITGDRCGLEKGILQFLGRVDDLVKVSGELVSISRLNSLAGRIAHDHGMDVAVVAVPDERRENLLVLVVEASRSGGHEMLSWINAELDPIERIGLAVSVEKLPRTDIGKLDRDTIHSEVMAALKD